MKIAVVYYSLEGNTAYASEKIAAELQADCIPLKPVQEYPARGLAKFYHGGKAAVFGEKPALHPYAFDISQYDCVILGCPVWAGSCAAPMNTFLAEHGQELTALGGDRIGILLCQSGNGAANVIEKYKKLLHVPGFRRELVLIDPRKRASAENDEAIRDFCRSFC